MNKKIILFIFNILLLTSIVLAGEIIHGEVIEEDSFAVLKERDAISLSYNNMDTLIIIRRIQDNNNAIDISLFSDAEDENALPFYTTLKVNDVINIDSNKDFNIDFLVGLYDITGNTVTLLFRSIEQENGNTGNTVKETGSSNTLFYVLIVVAILLFLILIRKRKKPEEDIDF